VRGATELGGADGGSCLCRIPQDVVVAMKGNGYCSVCGETEKM